VPDARVDLDPWELPVSVTDAREPQAS